MHSYENFLGMNGEYAENTVGLYVTKYSNKTWFLWE